MKFDAVFGVLALVALLLLLMTGCSVYTGEVRQCPAGWPQDVFDKIDEVKSVCRSS